MYSPEFYDAISQGCINSADVVVPAIIDLIHPKSVVDLGCGQGWWLSAFAKHGCEVLGIDGDYINRSTLAIPADKFLAHDLERELALGGSQYDLAVSLEVAEHLPEYASNTFIRTLTGLAPVILFSAAIPGQGGNGHINLKWPSYWIEKLNENGFIVSGALRWQFWDDRRIENWYRQNMLLCTSKDLPLEGPLKDVMTGLLSPVWHVVHPERI